MRTPPVFGLRLRGQNIYPETTDLNELSTLLQNVERAIKAVAQADRHVKTDFLLSLIDVGRGSNVLTFASSQPEVAIDSWRGVARAIVDDKVFGLPRAARSLVEEIVAFANRRDAITELLADDEPLAVIAPDTILTLTDSAVSGETILYGLVTRVGGREPKIGLTLDDGRFLPCEAPVEAVKELGKRLYERVGLRGLAEWDAVDLTVKSFKVEEVLEYTEIPISEALARLAEASGEDAWADEEDVVGFLTDFRRGDER